MDGQLTPRIAPPQAAGAALFSGLSRAGWRRRSIRWVWSGTWTNSDGADYSAGSIEPVTVATALLPAPSS